MIPLRLQVKNFMSYGESVPPLDLSGVRVACLSGDNGNGKTALLDAMTWALFGETRATTEDDVIRLGATDCQVILDFEVGDGAYRIYKARGRRGAAAWELQARQADGSVRGLSGTNARETKAKIEHILRMDYRTFLASGYLAQGRADEFARATVNDRKKVLADILDLSRYERLEQLAKDRRKEAEDRETDAEREIRAIENELENEDRYFLSLEAAQARLQTATDQQSALRAAYEKLLTEVDRLGEREAKAVEWEARIPEFEQEIAVSGRQLALIERRLADADAVLARRDSIQAAHARLIAVRQNLKPIEDEYDSMLALQREQTEIDRRIRAAFDALDRERYRLDCDTQTLEKEDGEQERYALEIDRLDAELASFGDLDQRRATVEQARADAGDALLDLKARSGTLKAQDALVETRLNALSGSDASLCEYCGQPLPPDRRQSAMAEAQALRADLAAQQEAVTRQGRDAKRHADTLRAESDRIQADSRHYSTMEVKRAQAIQEQHRITERTKTLPALRRRLAALTDQIARRAYAEADQERMVAVSAQLERSERVAAALADARAELSRYATAERDLLSLQSAEATQATEPALAADLSTAIAKRESQIAQARAKIAEIRAATASLPTLRRDLATLATDLRATEEFARAAEREIGQYTAQLAHCANLKVDLARRAEEHRQASAEKDSYKELIAAFGRKGVQALIIENALPTIENEANELLSRMTDGGLQLRLVTQRDAKSKTASGTAIETLDIVISDDLGTRPYELYSGGEAFRINFALRVALSRLLAHRAGAPLQTLILDEGFGTQDPKGREAIVDAINSISDSFALILVITHIEELKEAFPTRIEVTKGPGGSSFTIA